MFERTPPGIDSIEALLLDLSGVLYVGDEAVPGTREAVEMARGAGLPLRLITNTSRQPRRRILARLRSLGFDFPDEALTTAPSAIRAELERGDRTAKFVVHPDLRSEFEGCDSASGDADVVVLGDMGEHFSFDALNEAFRALMDGAELWVMGMNRYFPESGGLSLDLGPFVRALEYAAEVKAKNFGKPNRRIFHAAIEGLELPPERVLMVGDDYAGDIDGALSAGLAACLVRTGKYRAGDEDRISQPGAGLAEDLRGIVQGILKAA